MDNNWDEHVDYMFPCIFEDGNDGPSWRFTGEIVGADGDAVELEASDNENRVPLSERTYTTVHKGLADLKRMYPVLRQYSDGGYGPSHIPTLEDHSSKRLVYHIRCSDAPVDMGVAYVVVFSSLESRLPFKLAVATQCGRGEDGGFGDYANPRFGGLLMHDDKLVIVPVDVDDPTAIIDQVNNTLSSRFYSHGDHCSYDGAFPMEINGVWIPYHADECLQLTVDEYVELVVGLVGDATRW